MPVALKLLRQLLEHNIQPSLTQREIEKLLLTAIDDAENNLGIIKYLASKVSPEIKEKRTGGYTEFYSYLFRMSYLLSPRSPIKNYYQKIALVLAVINIFLEAGFVVDKEIFSLCYQLIKSPIILESFLEKQLLNVDDGLELLHRQKFWIFDNKEAYLRCLLKHKPFQASSSDS
jgi:hypothetical protein